MKISSQLRELHTASIKFNISFKLKQSFPNDKDEIDLLFKTFQIPDNCACLIDVFERVALINSTSVSKIKDLNFDNSIKRSSTIAEKIVSSSILNTLTDKYPIIKLDTWLTKAKQIEGIKQKLSPNDELISAWIFNAFHSYYGSNPIYTLFAYPYIAVPEAKKANFRASLEQHILVISVVLNLYLIHFSKHGESLIQFKDRTVDLRRMQLEENYLTFSLEHVESLKMLMNQLASINYRHPDKSTYRTIANYIKSYLCRNKHKQRSNGSTKTGQVSRKPFKGHGWGVTEDIYIADFLLEEQDEQDSDSLWIMKLAPKSTVNDRQQRVQKRDFGNAYILENRNFFNLESTSINSATRTKYVRLYNQAINDRLSSSEISKLKDSLSNRKDFSYEEARASIYILTTLLFGHPLNGENNIYIHEKTDDKKVEWVSGSINFIIHTDETTALIPVLNPGSSTTVDATELYESFAPNHISITLSDKIARLLRRLYLEFKTKSDGLEFESFYVRPLLNAVNVVLRKSGLDSRVTRSFLHKHVLREMLAVAGGDLWKGFALANHDKLLASTQKYYSTVKSKQLEDLHRHLLKIHFDITANAKSSAPNAKDYVGGNFLPKRPLLRSITKKCLSKLDNLKLSEIHDPEHLILMVNLMSFYTHWLISFSLASRNNKCPYISPEQISIEGLCWLNDKNRNNGYSAKTLYLSVEARKQLRIYEAFKKELNDLSLERGWEIKTPSTAKGYLFFTKVSRGLECTSLIGKTFTMHSAQAELSKHSEVNLKEIDTLVVNCARHYMRSKALVSDVPPEVIDSFMGHWHEGNEPWSPYGIFDNKKNQRELKIFVEYITNDIGLRAINWTDKT